MFTLVHARRSSGVLVLVLVTLGLLLAGLALGGQATATRKAGNDQERYLGTSSTQGSFALAAGRTTTSPEVASTRRLVTLGPAFRGLRLQFFGTGSDNTTFDYRVWIVRKGLNSRPYHTPGAAPGYGDWSLEYFGGGTATLSTAVGAAASNVPVLSSERIADTLTWTVSTTATTPKGPGASIEASNGLGTSWVYSPADNTPAWLSIPDLDGAPYVLIEFDLTGATDANCVFEPTP